MLQNFKSDIVYQSEFPEEISLFTEKENWLICLLHWLIASLSGNVIYVCLFTFLYTGLLLWNVWLFFGFFWRCVWLFYVLAIWQPWCLLLVGDDLREFNSELLVFTFSEKMSNEAMVWKHLRNYSTGLCCKTHHALHQAHCWRSFGMWRFVSNFDT